VIVFIKSKGQIIFGFLFLLSVVPFFCPTQVNNEVDNAKKELFNSELGCVNSIDKALNYADSIYYKTHNNSEFDTAHYVQIVSKFTKERFYHGLSHYSLSDNWIANLAGKLFWSHISAIVNPDDILKHSEGLCSQQTIVFMEILKNRGINVRSVGLGYLEGPGHFLCEVKYDNKWHLHDVTLEPKWKKVVYDHESMDYYLMNKDTLYATYESRMPKHMFNKLVEKVKYGSVNAFPARKMLLFHNITLFLTYSLPLFFFVMFAIHLFRTKRRKKLPGN
jgi:hypothetical protein